MLEGSATATTEPIIPFADSSEPQAIVEAPEELKIQCVFYVGDILTTLQKTSSPRFRLGGKEFPFQDFRTVPHSIGQRCGIIRLQKGYRSVHKNMVDKEKWENYVAAYKIPHWWNPVTGKFEEKIVGKDGASKDLLYKEIRPIHELGRIAGQQNGVVDLTMEAGFASAADIKEAQLFYFPNWLEILAGKEALPERLREVQDYIENRREQTQDEHLRYIGDRFLQSCSDYYDFGQAYVTFQSQVIKETEKFPGGARYDEIAERFFRTLGLTREDKMVQDFGANQAAAAQSNANLTEAMAMMAKSQVKMDNVFTTMVDILADKQGVVPPESQAPAPATVEEAAAELDRAVEESVEAVEAVAPEVEDSFVDMSDAVIEPDVEAGVEIEKDEK